MADAGPPAAQEEYVPESILITGGCGFIASHVVNRLSERYPHYKVRRRFAQNSFFQLSKGPLSLSCAPASLSPSVCLFAGDGRVCRGRAGARPHLLTRFTRSACAQREREAASGARATSERPRARETDTDADASLERLSANRPKSNNTPSKTDRRAGQDGLLREPQEHRPGPQEPQCQGAF
jgi:hypothetical protein